MLGARKYADLFERSQQHGKLYLKVGNHARGKTFNMWVLPSEDKITNFNYVTQDAIEVYGITGGQPGWTEVYGWLHKGKWQEDFEKVVRSKELEREAKIRQEITTTEEAEKKKRERIVNLLKAY